MYNDYYKHDSTLRLNKTFMIQVISIYKHLKCWEGISIAKPLIIADVAFKSEEISYALGISMDY